MVFVKMGLTLFAIGAVALGVLFVISLLLLSVAGRAILAMMFAAGYLAWEGVKR
jgi:hypothetical protein